MGAAFPELVRGEALIGETLKLEESRFKTTLENGLKLLDEATEEMGGQGELDGETAFKLYDTFGFPLDLTQDALREKGRAVDTSGFDAAMDAQKAKARAAWSGSGEAADAAIWFDLADQGGPTEFLGYDTEIAEGQITALVRDGIVQARATAGEGLAIIVNQTPFYAESGGQVGDTGLIRTATGTARVNDTKKVAGLFLHMAEVVIGEILPGQGAELVVDHARRADIRANHSATHLLHEALRRALGDHVAQRGSLNAPDRLRFDFSHAKALSAEELAQIEAEVNTFIRQNSAVETRIMTPDEARDLGAQALFGEKYGDEVRVVSMGSQAGSGKGMDGQTYSLELCGGTHVRQTGDIGLFVALGDSASSSGVRRIEALTGPAALAYLTGQERRMQALTQEMNATADEVLERVRILKDERKRLENEVAQLRRQLAMAGGADQAAAAVESVNGIAFHAQALGGVTARDLAGLIDDHKARLGSGAVLLIADTGGKAAIAAGVTDDLTGRLSAVELVRAAVAELGGQGGGGRADFAQGGGKDVANAPAAIAAAQAVLKGV
uniref:alanine--tRNA ligase-related protein n=1 Tax=Roseicyclus sp. TaxID=1914329 RepID=UPI0040546288